MPVNSSPLERSAQGGESRNLIKIFSDFCHSSLVHPKGGEIEENHHGYTCMWSLLTININIFIIAVLNKSEKVLGCKSK